MDLTSNDYYELNYSLIPDNIYQQIVGVIKKTEYSTESYYETPDAITYIDVIKRLGDYEHVLMPIISILSSDYYTDTYKETVTYENDGAAYPTKTRTEKVSGRIELGIRADIPIKYIPSESEVTITDVVGTTYSRNQTNVTGIEGLWGEAFWGETDRLYALVNYNMTGGGNYTSTPLNDVEIEKVVVDPYYDGSRLDVGGKYYIRMWVYVYPYSAYLYNKASILGNTSQLDISLATSFKITVPYFAATEVEEEFEYHVDTIDYQNYALKITGNYLTNRNTIYDEDTPWDEFISDMLLDKYRNGKLWISAKVKASFLLDNDLVIDSIINIKKLNGTYISRFGRTLSFQLKNIEYSYSGSQFIANIILLEV